MSENLHFTRVTFSHFKAFRSFNFHVRHFNILVGPNNAGKSTVIAAFRILAMAMKKARSRKAEVVDGPDGTTRGYRIDISAISVAEENIFYNYDASNAATISFKLSNGSELLLFFSEGGSCVLIAKCDKSCQTPATFRSQFPCSIGFTPVLGPVEHRERLYEREAAQRALYNYSASRNFRNIWYHFPEKFNDFRSLLSRTWPGMDIERPVISMEDGSPFLYMMCPEDRIPREICWAGFGFQVWCQMLTHLVQSSDCSMFLIDEPDIYLHSDLQRQLLSILRDLGPDVILATHSTEIITEAEPDEIVLVDKKRRQGKRIKNVTDLGGIFGVLGSNLNPVLTQLAKTKRAVFVEGKDFQILSRFADKLGFGIVANRSKFAVIPVEGFNPQKIKNLIEGIQATLGGEIAAFTILDRDYRSEEERLSISVECEKYCEKVQIHSRKEIENYLLVPAAIDRAIMKKINDRSKRTGQSNEFDSLAEEVLEAFADTKKHYVSSQYLAGRKSFDRKSGTGVHEATLNEKILHEIDEVWKTMDGRLSVIPGKEAIAVLNRALQDKFSISVTAGAIVGSMRKEDVPSEMQTLISDLDGFSK